MVGRCILGGRPAPRCDVRVCSVCAFPVPNRGQLYRGSPDHLGYSINATIVVYDRIRENKRLLGSKVTVDEVVNVSINQSLTRSINTTVSTVIAMGTVCVISVIYHVESILVFSLPMLIGMVAGAYSSVCLAGPLWATWQNYKAAQNKQK